MASLLATVTDRAAPARAPERRIGPIQARIQDRLGRYQLERILGTGGMGVVYRAFDPELARAVAIKVLKSGEEQSARLRLLREARAMAQLSHPNVVTVYEVGTDLGHDFIVMELVEGITLARWLRDHAPSHGRIVEAFLAAGRGLAAAHAAGMIHRDFKPDNVLRTPDGRVVVGDFGLARAEHELPNGMPVARGTLPSITCEGIAGTPAYMAPEQWRGEEITTAVDQWALSVALWEALTGARPFTKVTLETIATSTWVLPPARLPRDLRGVLARGLDPDPAKRWPDLDTFLDRLAATQASRLHVIGACGVVGAIVAIALGASSMAPEPSTSPAFACGEAPPAATNAVPDREAAAMLAEDARRTNELRARACASEAPRREEVACLDGVRARQAIVQRALAGSPDPALDAGALLVDPAVCRSTTPPRLATAWGDGAIAGFAAQLDRSVPLASGSLDPCAQALAMLAVAGDHRRAAETAVALAEVCGDRRLIADALLVQLHHQVTDDRYGAVERAIRRTSDAIREVEQPDLLGVLAVERARYAASRHATAERVRHLDTAIELLRERRPRHRLEIVDERIEASAAGAAHLIDELRTHDAHRTHRALGHDEHDHELHDRDHDHTHDHDRD